MDVLVEALGWGGAALVLGAYLLSSRDIWPASDPKSAIANITGAALLIVNGWYHGAFPSVGLNVVWVAIGAATLVRVAGAHASPAAEGASPDGRRLGP